MKKNSKQSSSPPDLAKAKDTPPVDASHRPNSWGATGMLIGLAWGALIVFGLLWRLWSGNGIIILLSVFLIGLCFTLAAIFDHFLRQ